MPRILLLLPTGTYRAADFLAAAARLGVDVVVGSERPSGLGRLHGRPGRSRASGCRRAAVDAIVALHRRTPLDAVLAVDDQGVAIAAAAAARLGFRHNPPEAVATTKDKARMRDRPWPAASLPQPAYRIVAHDADVASAATDVGYPCVVKPVSRSASQGVIRADDAPRPMRPPSAFAPSWG